MILFPDTLQFSVDPACISPNEQHTAWTEFDRVELYVEMSDWHDDKSDCIMALKFLAWVRFPCIWLAFSWHEARFCWAELSCDCTDETLACVWFSWNWDELSWYSEEFSWFSRVVI